MQGRLGSIPGQGTRSLMPQQKSKILSAANKTWHSYIYIYIYFFFFNDGRVELTWSGIERWPTKSVRTSGSLESRGPQVKLAEFFRSQEWCSQFSSMPQPYPQVPLLFLCTPASLSAVTPTTLPVACLQTFCHGKHLPSAWELTSPCGHGGTTIPAPSPFEINLMCVFFEVSQSFPPWS